MSSHSIALCGLLLTISFQRGQSKTTGFAIENYQKNHREMVYGNLLKHIYKEQEFGSILLVHQTSIGDISLKAFLQLDLPKVILTSPVQKTFCYKDFYNSEIVVVWLISYSLNTTNAIKKAGEILNYMRQTRILVIGEMIAEEEYFKLQLLKELELQKMTNVLLIFSHPQSQSLQHFTLQPYPEYHWLRWQHSLYFNKNWKNLQNKTLKTYVDQTPSRALVYTDAEGALQMSGFVAKFILLFAELVSKYDASLSMFYALEVGNKTIYTLINAMVSENLLDIPIALAALAAPTQRNVTDFYELNQLFIIVPLAQPLSVQQIYGVLLNGIFSMSIVLGFLVFSIAHSVLAYAQQQQHLRRNCLDVVFNVKILSGVLGLAIWARPKPKLSLKLFFILLGYFGLNISTLFGANFKTLMTTPPYGRQIRNNEDLLHSSVRLLALAGDPVLVDPKLLPLKPIYALTNNLTEVHETRKVLNISYCYGVTTATYNLLERQQKYYYSRPTFFAPEDLILYSMMPWGFQLQHNSPYKEPMNRLIHQVHAGGLMQAWHDFLFLDMLKLKEIPKNDPNSQQNLNVIRVEDLTWVWIIVAAGWAASTLVFLVELCMGKKTIEVGK